MTSAELVWQTWIAEPYDQKAMANAVTALRCQPDLAAENEKLRTRNTELLAACARVLRALEWSSPDDRMFGCEMADTLRAAIAKEPQ